MSDALVALCAQIARVDRRDVKAQTVWMSDKSWKRIRSLNTRIPEGVQWCKGHFLPFTEVTIDGRVAVYVSWNTIIYKDRSVLTRDYDPGRQLERLKKKLAVALASWAKGGEPRKVVVDVPGRKRLLSAVG